eukprot:jgi/Chlat1/3510/Chrsp23S03698
MEDTTWRTREGFGGPEEVVTEAPARYDAPAGSDYIPQPTQAEAGHVKTAAGGVAGGVSPVEAAKNVAFAALEQIQQVAASAKAYVAGEHPTTEQGSGVSGDNTSSLHPEATKPSLLQQAKEYVTGTTPSDQTTSELSSDTSGMQDAAKPGLLQQAKEYIAGTSPTSTTEAKPGLLQQAKEYLTAPIPEGNPLGQKSTSTDDESSVARGYGTTAGSEVPTADASSKNVDLSTSGTIPMGTDAATAARDYSSIAGQPASGATPDYTSAQVGRESGYPTDVTNVSDISFTPTEPVPQFDRGTGYTEGYQPTLGGGVVATPIEPVSQFDRGTGYTEGYQPTLGDGVVNDAGLAQRDINLPVVAAIPQMLHVRDHTVTTGDDKIQVRVHPVVIESDTPPMYTTTQQPTSAAAPVAYTGASHMSDAPAAAYNVLEGGKVVPRDTGIIGHDTTPAAASYDTTVNDRQTSNPLSKLFPAPYDALTGQDNEVPSSGMPSSGYDASIPAHDKNLVQEERSGMGGVQPAVGSALEPGAVGGYGATEVDLSKFREQDPNREGYIGGGAPISASAGHEPYEVATDPRQEEHSKAKLGAAALGAGALGAYAGHALTDTDNSGYIAGPTATSEKPGMLEKVKEMLPGQHHTQTGTAQPAAYDSTTSTEKPGMFTKVKDMLSGHHTTEQDTQYESTDRDGAKYGAAALGGGSLGAVAGHELASDQPTSVTSDPYAATGEHFTTTEQTGTYVSPYATSATPITSSTSPVVARTSEILPESVSDTHGVIPQGLAETGLVAGPDGAALTAGAGLPSYEAAKPTVPEEAASLVPETLPTTHMTPAQTLVFEVTEANGLELGCLVTVKSGAPTPGWRTQWSRVMGDGTVHILDGADGPSYAPEPNDVGSILRADVATPDGPTFVISAQEPVKFSATTEADVARLATNLSGSSFPVNLLEVNLVPEQDVLVEHVLEVLPEGVRVSKAGMTVMQDPYSNAMLLCGMRSSSLDATHSLFIRMNATLAAVLKFHSAAERNAALMYIRTLGKNAGVIIHDPTTLYNKLDTRHAHLAVAPSTSPTTSPMAATVPSSSLWHFGQPTAAHVVPGSERVVNVGPGILDPPGTHFDEYAPTKSGY